MNVFTYYKLIAVIRSEGRILREYLPSSQCSKIIDYDPITPMVLVSMVTISYPWTISYSFDLDGRRKSMEYKKIIIPISIIILLFTYFCLRNDIEDNKIIYVDIHTDMDKLEDNKLIVVNDFKTLDHIKSIISNKMFHTVVLDKSKYEVSIDEANKFNLLGYYYNPLIDFSYPIYSQNMRNDEDISLFYDYIVHQREGINYISSSNFSNLCIENPELGEYYIMGDKLLFSKIIETEEVDEHLNNLQFTSVYIELFSRKKDKLEYDIELDFGNRKIMNYNPQKIDGKSSSLQSNSELGDVEIRLYNPIFVDKNEGGIGSSGLSYNIISKGKHNLINSIFTMELMKEDENIKGETMIRYNIDNKVIEVKK